MAANLYKQVVQVTHTYLGPAADRFIARQIENHLHIEPVALKPKDLRQLIDWIRVAVSLLTDDIAIIEEYVARLEVLADGPRQAIYPKKTLHKKPPNAEK